MLTRVLDGRPERPFPSALRTVLLGGAPTPPELFERCAELGLPVVQTWGMTEAASQVATASPGSDRPQRMAPLAFARVSQDDDRLRVAGPLIGAARTTGDLGRVEPDGGIRVSGRVDAVINRGGEKVHPAEVEAVLCEHPSIAEAAVVGLPDAACGERVVAAVVGAGVATCADAALFAWCTKRLEAYKIPTQIARLDALPRTDLGKIRRAVVRRHFQDIAPRSPALKEVSR
jgi:O-succinylbenzoic acid--CoA ligase